MSAYVVNKAHIDYLTRAASLYRIIPPDQRHDYGRNLWAQNVASVRFRYPDHDIDDPSTNYRYTPPRTPHNPLFVLSAIACYEYQTCETPDWEEMQAIKDVRELHRTSVRNLPGYDEAPWEITD